MININVNSERNGFTPIPNFILYSSEIKPLEKLVYEILISFSPTFPSLNRISQLSGISKNTTIKCIKNLSEISVFGVPLIKIIKSKKSNTPTNNVNHYIIPRWTNVNIKELNTLTPENLKSFSELINSLIDTDNVNLVVNIADLINSVGIKFDTNKTEKNNIKGSAPDEPVKSKGSAPVDWVNVSITSNSENNTGGSAPVDWNSAPVAPGVVHQMNQGSAPDAPGVVHQMDSNKTNINKLNCNNIKLNKNNNNLALENLETSVQFEEIINSEEKASLILQHEEDQHDEAKSEEINKEIEKDQILQIDQNKKTNKEIEINKEKDDIYSYIRQTNLTVFQNFSLEDFESKFENPSLVEFRKKYGMDPIQYIDQNMDLPRAPKKEKQEVILQHQEEEELEKKETEEIKQELLQDFKQIPEKEINRIKKEIEKEEKEKYYLNIQQCFSTQFPAENKKNEQETIYDILIDYNQFQKKYGNLSQKEFENLFWNPSLDLFIIQYGINPVEYLNIFGNLPSISEVKKEESELIPEDCLQLTN